MCSCKALPGRLGEGWLGAVQLIQRMPSPRWQQAFMLFFFQHPRGVAGTLQQGGQAGVKSRGGAAAAGVCSRSR